MRHAHSMDSVEWYTPAPVVDRARASLGGRIILDPCSCELAQSVVRAEGYCDTDGLTALRRCARGDTVFANPPSPPLPWLVECVLAWQRGARLVYLAYSIQQIQQAANWGRLSLVGAQLVIPYARIAYDADAERLRAGYAARGAKVPRRIAEAPAGTRVRGTQPPHASALILLGADPDPWRDFGAIATIV